MVEDQLIEGEDLAEAAVAAGWSRTFVRQGFMRGIMTTMTELKRAGRDVGDVRAERLFQNPFHRKQLETLYQVNLESLKGMSEDMASKIRREIGEGMLEGQNPRAMARDITDVVDVSSNRARMIARTETIRANAEGTLATFQAFGERGVQLEAEWLTAGDDRVCTKCEEHEGDVVPIEEAHGMIPFHPNCRCDWLPLQDTDTPLRGEEE